MSDEVKPEIIQKTQKTLGKYVKKPTLTEKLLKKPPFRFLHDIVKAVIKETGFLKGLYKDQELNSENVKEKDAKISFLNKLINAVKTITKTELKVKSSKIVAGLEPTETNLLLQAIAKAIEHKLDSTEYVKNLNLSENEKKKLKKPDDVKKDKPKKSSKAALSGDDKKSKKSSKSTTNIETPKSTERTKSNSTSKESVGTIKKTSKRSKEDVKEKKLGKVEKIENRESKNKIAEIEENKLDEILIDELKDLTNINETVVKENELENREATSNEKNIPEASEETKQKESKFIEVENIQNPVVENEEKPVESHVFKRQNSASLVRPKSARPKSGEAEQLKQRIVEIPLSHVPSTTNSPEISHNANTQRPKSSLRPPSVRPPSARPGAPRLRPDSALPIHESVTMGNINVIVENADAGDDEETVVIQTAPDVAISDEATDGDKTEIQISEDNQGHLVEQILKQIEDEGDDIKRKVDIDWEQDALRGKETANKEITQLRSLIQNLTKTANPLGKLLNYLHEDIEAMHSELQVWSNIKKQALKEIEKQKRSFVELNKPLLVQLEQIQHEIVKQEEEIINIQSTIIRNDARIKELLIK